MFYCRKCGSHLPENAAVCGNCHYRVVEAVYCHRCAAELPPNSTRCIDCNAKSVAHKRLIHWLPLPLTIVALAFYAFGGYYYFDTALQAYDYNRPYASILDYLALLLSMIAFAMSIFTIPGKRVVLKIISILLSGIMMLLAVLWIIDVLFAL